MTTEIHADTSPGPGRINEDYYLVRPGLVGVFDGVTLPLDMAPACRHGAAWYVAQLARHIAQQHERSPNAPLSTLLASAIEATRGDHDEDCNLERPHTAAATVVLLRERAHEVDYLVLCDGYLVVDQGERLDVLTDQRFADVIAQLRDSAPGTQSSTDRELPRHLPPTVDKWNHVNREGGYWIAAANPDAAEHAITGTLPLRGPQRVRRAALLTDGAACAVELFQLLDWRSLLDLLTEHGPRELIRRVRQAEDADPHGQRRPRHKRHDDATAILCLFDDEEPS